MKDFATPGQKRGFGVFQGGNPSCTTCHAGAALSDATVSHAARFGLINGDGGDQGFHNIGVRPTAEDLGRGAKGQGGVAFSESGSAVDMGAFKTPALRNVGLTAPYFHNGGKATLADVVDFYSRGGDFNNVEKSRFIVPRNFSAQDRAALAEFLQDGLTDCRLANKEAPFDHPSITIPNGKVDPITGLPGDLAIAETGGAHTCP